MGSSSPQRIICIAMLLQLNNTILSRAIYLFLGRLGGKIDEEGVSCMLVFCKYMLINCQISLDWLRSVYAG
eukprot:scaffold5017_cov105-Skeletonema_dohrnii-CCMP3373.AAC.6